MIKYLQKLKAKKGFTLVELIVVIAIIGVLAAILIPVMLGYVTSSRVTSADTTASELQKSVNNWLTDMDSKGVGMKKNATNVLVIYCGFAEGNTGGNQGDMRCEVDGTAIANAYVTANWNVKTSVCATGADLENNFEAYLGNLMPDASGTAAIVIIGGDVKFVAWTPDAEGGTSADVAATEITTLIADYSDMDASNDTFAGWGNPAGTGTNGIGSDGQTYGTAPVSQNPVM